MSEQQAQSELYVLFTMDNGYVNTFGALEHPASMPHGTQMTIYPLCSANAAAVATNGERFQQFLALLHGCAQDLASDLGRPGARLVRLFHTPAGSDGGPGPEWATKMSDMVRH